MSMNMSIAERTAAQVLRQARRQFTERLLPELRGRGRPVTTAARGALVCWPDPGQRLGWVEVQAYTGPDDRHPDKPLIARIFLCHFSQPVPRRVARALGLRPQGTWTGHYAHLGGFEFSCLPEELASLAPWLAQWIVARTDPSLPLAAPPVPITGIDPEEIREWRYEWTKAAQARLLAWRRLDAERQRRRAEARQRWLAARGVPPPPTGASPGLSSP